jgi:hypothetical protein
MKLTNLRTEDWGDRRRVSADVTWESADRPSQVLFFETAAPAAADLEPSPNAFVLASLPFALWQGEPRLQVAGALCPRLYHGLTAAMAIYAQWYSHCRPLEIEPLDGLVPSQPGPTPRTASFLSGGVDGLAVLRRNRLDFSLDHPESIQTALLLFGVNAFDMTESGAVPERLKSFQYTEKRLQQLGLAEHFELVTVHTNARLLSPNYHCWTTLGYGAANLSVAHVLSARWTRVLFASGGEGPNPTSGASHPLIDQFFSTAAVEVWHEQAELTRLQKLSLLAAWPPALAIMQPCHQIRVLRPDQINCGTCEKCVRTMLGLLVQGKLAQASAFQQDDVTPDMIANIPIHSAKKGDLLVQLLEPLAAIGRQDLVQAIRRKLRRAQVKRWLGSV